MFVLLKLTAFLFSGGGQNQDYLVEYDLSNNTIACSQQYDSNKFNLLCLKNQESERIEIFVPESPCSSDVYPQNLQPDFRDYVVLNDGREFGTSTHTSVLINISNNRFVVADNFTTPTQRFRRRIVFEDPPTSHNFAELSTISISECPGDFSNSAVCVFDVNRGSNLYISTRLNEDPDQYCILEPGTSYYFNVINSPFPYSVQPYCRNLSDSECAIFYTEVFHD